MCCVVSCVSVCVQSGGAREGDELNVVWVVDSEQLPFYRYSRQGVSRTHPLVDGVSLGLVAEECRCLSFPFGFFVCAFQLSMWALSFWVKRWSERPVLLHNTHAHQVCSCGTCFFFLRFCFPFSSTSMSVSHQG